MSNSPLFSARPAHDDPVPFLLAGAGGKGHAGETYFLGNRYDGLAGTEGQVIDLLPQVEFERVTPVAFAFYADPSLASAVVVGNDVGSWSYNFSSSHADSDPGAGKLRLSSGLDDSIQLFVSKTDLLPHNATTLQAFAVAHSDSPSSSPSDGVFADSARLLLTWTSGPDSQAMEYQVVGVEVAAAYLRFTFSPTNSPGYSVALINNQDVTLQLTAPKPPPNAAVRARITYSAGTAGNLSFDADWAGGLILHAKRFSVSRVNVPLDPRRRYADSQLSVAVTTCPAAPHSPHAPSLTYPPLVVAPDATRLIAVPPLARRVSLLCLYEVGDAPLSYFHLAFATKLGNSVSWIDALSARAALFGEGLGIPPGCTTLALTNRSADPTAQLGATFHLGI